MFASAHFPFGPRGFTVSSAQGSVNDVDLDPVHLQLRGEALQLGAEAREMVREGITHFTEEHEPDNRYFRSPAAPAARRSSSLPLLGAGALHVDALVRAPDPDLGDIGLADPERERGRPPRCSSVYGRPMTSHSPVSSTSRSSI
jgi:hypothetical protein